MNRVRRLLPVLSAILLLWGLVFTAYSLVSTGGHVDRYTGFSVILALVGALGLYKTLKGSSKDLNESTLDR
jgi:hypothetical protein